MHPTGVASAASVFASAPNKVPFYVAGGLLACWAVLVAITGITHHDFPRSAGTGAARDADEHRARRGHAHCRGRHRRRRERGGRGAGRSRPIGGRSADVEGAGARGRTDRRPLYDKDRAAVKAGKVEIRLANASSVGHNVTITRGTGTVAATKTIKSGSTTPTVSLPPGDYVFFCSVDAHRESGMEGALTAS